MSAIAHSLTAAALLLYLAALAAALASRRAAPARPPGALVVSAACAVPVHGAALLAWWREVGHGPYLAPFEVLSSDAWLLGAAFLALLRREPALWRLAPFVYGLAAALVGAAVALGPAAVPLPAVMRSPWLVVHVSAHKLAFVTVALATALALREARRGQERLGPDARRWGGMGFALWTVGMLTGSIWGYGRSGRFWGWDSVEIWSLVAWAALGAQLHALRFYAPGPRARAALQAAALAVVAFALFASPRLGAAMHTSYLPR